ncbi:hypothetical protein M2324_003888 [Rhodovulum sulfidophilum]|uniref:hypothetical protein n=1 Tax=Rhodovulum sulfidophilum TaxID=35806 RepID=UPI001E41421E|nr:hypothetical protein [Rhodovulum sulfidophilum]MCW2305462.1 hypothetical protein [Rhodovulum sulfidophilum]
MNPTRRAEERTTYGILDRAEGIGDREDASPHNQSLKRLSAEEGISIGTLSRWRSEARAWGDLLPDGQSGPEGWSSEDKFAAAIETAALNEAELSEYCRQRGLYPEQVRVWREACARANDWDRAASRQIAQETKDDRKRIRELERELARKEKALAEAAALLLLEKRRKRSGAAGRERTNDLCP